MNGNTKAGLPPIARRGRLTLRRGMALLLVMIGVVVCTVLTAGFLATQGTSIGIARNERDAAKSHAIAQTGIDMCYWLIRNRPDWRETMPLGNWISNTPVGDGTVSVYVDDDDHNFANDPALPVTLTSTGSYDNRAFTLTATVRPTGGGTVFQRGNFIDGKVLLGNGDLVTPVVLDSYNSALANYNSLLAASNANIGSNCLLDGGLKVYYPSLFRGEYIAAPAANLATVMQLLGNAPAPASTSHAIESRNPGTVIFPNMAGLVYRGTVNKSNSLTAFNIPGPGIYDDFKANNATININAGGTYYVKNDINIGTTTISCLSVSDNVTANVIVHGNIILNGGKIALGANARLQLFVSGDVTVNNGYMNSSILGNGVTSHLVLFGDNAGGAIRISNTLSNFCGIIYAPQHDLTLQTGGPKLFGAVVAKSLTVKDTAGFHFDEALRSEVISYVTGGTAPPGAPDYLITVNAGPGVSR
jgi:hypothetical protein